MLFRCCSPEQHFLFPHFHNFPRLFSLQIFDRRHYINRNVSSTVRSKGTGQSATWRFRQFNKRSKLLNFQLFVVITRNDHPWGEPHSATVEPYALAVCFRDRTNQEARLYSQVQNKLRLRDRTRARV